MKVEIYTTDTCPWCDKAKAFFKENKVEFTEHNVREDEKAREKMIEKSGQMGVPVIDINGEIIIGFDEDAIRKELNLN